MKRRGKDIAPLQNPKRKLRNRYQSESQRLQHERSIAHSMSTIDNAQYHTRLETSSTSSQEMDSSSQDSQEIQVEEDVASVAHETVIGPNTILKATETPKEESPISFGKSGLKKTPVRIRKSPSPAFIGKDLSFQNKISTLKSPGLPHKKDAEKSHDHISGAVTQPTASPADSHLTTNDEKEEAMRSTDADEDVNKEPDEGQKNELEDNDGNDSVQRKPAVLTKDSCSTHQIHALTDDDTNDEASKDESSRCSMDDSCDKNYRVNVGLYGTDIDEDLSRDENDGLSLPHKTCLDMNNNQPESVQQIKDDSQAISSRPKPNVGSFSHERPMDEGSNTVDGFTRRALESHCNIIDVHDEQTSTEKTPINEEIKVPRVTGLADASDNAVTLMIKPDVLSTKSSTPLNDPSKGMHYPTDFSGVFKQGDTGSITDHGSSFTSTNLPQSHGSYYRPPDSGRYCRGGTPNVLSPRYTTRQGLLTSPLNVDENMVAEQLASELVQTYSGENSHMISDILRRREGHYCSTDPNTGGHRQFEDLAATQNVIHDVDLLNTPQQLPPVESDYPSNQCYNHGNGPISHTYRNPHSLSTPESYRRNGGRRTPVEMHGRMTYNDIQVYGGKWSTNNRQETVTNPSFNQELSENPYPNQYEHNPAPRHLYSPNTVARDGMSLQQRSCMGPYPSHGRSGTGLHTPQGFQTIPNDYRQFNIDTHLNKPEDLSPRAYPRAHVPGGGVYQQSPDPLGLVGIGGGCPCPAEEVTKMTYTPRGVMHTHVSQNNHYPKPKGPPKQPISDMDYSSIYPSREYIDSHVTGRNTSPSQALYETQPKGYKNINKQQQPRRHKHKPSKYDQIPLRAPPMPIFDEMMSKYPPSYARETEPLNTRHKYLVVNPSSATEIPSQTLLMKYIDFLILENEQITDISQSIGATEDIYVTEDMYFMETVKYTAPFPSNKFTEWVRSFFPHVNLDSMKFKGRYPSAFDRDVRMTDPRPTQQVLEDTFYFFQRALMNVECP